MRLTSKSIALGICAYFVFLAVWYASATPAFEAPDEGAHFLYIHNLLETHRLPVLESREVVFESQSTQRHHPPLYYLIGAALIAGTQRKDVQDYLRANPFAAIGTVSVNNQNAFLHMPEHSGDTGAAIWILRLYSITLATITLWFVYAAGKLAFGRDSVGLLAMLLVASIPGFVFIGASINNDNLVTMFYAVGIYRCLRMWKQRYISQADMVIMGLVLAGTALSKLTGLTLFALVYLSLLVGVYKRYYNWRRAVKLVLVSLLISGLLAGWWYLRNLILYGDPLALQATLAIWSRGADNAPGLGELIGVWESFWMVLGNFNLRGPDWLYIYVTGITILGAAGAVLAAWRSVGQRYNLALLLSVCVLVFASLLAATRQINVSQGRILYPMLVGFAPLIAGGWHTLLRRRASSLLIIPLAVIAVATPAVYLSAAYTPLDTVKVLPADVRPMSIQTGGLHILGYQLETDTVSPGSVIHLSLYFAGQDAVNPHLFVKAIDPVSNTLMGGSDLYPGMAPTSALRPEESGIIYRAPVRFRLDSAPPLTPVQLNLQIGWNSSGNILPLFDTNANRRLNALVLPGPTLLDSAQPPAVPSVAANVSYGDLIRLSGYTLSTSEPRPGSTLTLTLVWRCLKRIDGDYKAAVGLLDANNQVVAQADGTPKGYPTAAWRPGPDFADARQIKLPSDLAPGAYTVYVGWYNSATGERLSARGGNVSPTLNLAEIPVTVR